jgi:hemerythrin-like metal-binding protein
VEFTQWTTQYSVGDPLMDAYHHIFFKTIHDLARELAELPSQAVEERIAFLMNYASMHFDSEEQLLQEVAFPELEDHKALHLAFKADLTGLQERYLANPSIATAEELLELSQAWLHQHILGEDMKYKVFVQR